MKVIALDKMLKHLTYKEFLNSMNKMLKKENRYQKGKGKLQKKKLKKIKLMKFSIMAICLMRIKKTPHLYCL